jgi:nucleotide-binding universal stress UspA family protein
MSPYARGVSMKNIVICVDLNEFSMKTLESFKNKIDLTKSTVHLVHVFEIHTGNIEFTPVIYPTANQYPEIEESVVSMLSKLALKLNLKSEQVQTKCFFNYSKESCMNTYLNEVKADLVVLATRGKHGISGYFASSLAEYLCKYAPCDVFVLRPETK